MKRLGMQLVIITDILDMKRKRLKKQNHMSINKIDQILETKNTKTFFFKIEVTLINSII